MKSPEKANKNPQKPEKIPTKHNTENQYKTTQDPIVNIKIETRKKIKNKKKPHHEIGSSSPEEHCPNLKSKAHAEIHAAATKTMERSRSKHHRHHHHHMGSDKRERGESLLMASNLKGIEKTLAWRCC